jgi:hypothetical protein
MSKILTVVWNTINEVNFCIVCTFLVTMRLKLGALNSCLLLIFLNICKLNFSHAVHNKTMTMYVYVYVCVYIYRYIYIYIASVICSKQ